MDNTFVSALAAGGLSVFGHGEGDQYLRWSGEGWRSCCREDLSLWCCNRIASDSPERTLAEVNVRSRDACLPFRGVKLLCPNRFRLLHLRFTDQY